MEHHPLRKVGIGGHQSERPFVGRRVDVVVVEGGGGEVELCQHDAGERQRAGSHEGHLLGSAAAAVGGVPAKDGVLKQAEFEIVVVIGEDVNML